MELARTSVYADVNINVYGFVYVNMYISLNVRDEMAKENLK